MATDIKNLHLPLPMELYDALRGIAVAEGRPATHVARQAIRQWLRLREKARLAEEIAAYAGACAGTASDLDPDLEEAATEFLRVPDEADR